MKIALPIAEGQLCMHFGHCEKFLVVDVDDETKEIKDQALHQPPPHEPGVLPAWLHEMGANVIIAGGMGQRAQQLFAQNDIKVMVGAPADSPETLVKALLEEKLVSGTNICDH
jgi:ATP-binding protein involved in chromosome partitioning